MGGSKMEIVFGLGKTAVLLAQLTAQFAPVPGIGPAVEIFCTIVMLCDNVSVNKRAMYQLCNRCQSLLVVFRDSTPNANLTTASNAMTETLEKVQTEIKSWAKRNRIEAFAMQGNIQDSIQRCHNHITDCLSQFHVVSNFEIHEWQSQFEACMKQDHEEIIGYLAEIANAGMITQAVVAENNKMLHGVMYNMQHALAEPAGNRITAGLQSNLYQIQVESKTLLPEFNLKRGEVTRIGQFPVSGSASMDIWEGLYLGREKVAIKVIRAVTSDPRSLQRFKREVKVWGDIWKIDGGKHILPFYGFCQNDGPYPYMVSPWQSNGTAISYVKKYPNIDYRQLIRGIAEGFCILHSMTPPVVHGDIKGSNIVIDGAGNPLIADFGVSRIVEDITGVPFSQSNGVSDSYRWFAPELCIGQGMLSIRSDVYAFGMTVLELITNQQPYSYIKHTTEVVIKAASGIRPRRPTELLIVQRGLDDDLWELLMNCWGDLTIRPSIQEVLARLP